MIPWERETYIALLLQYIKDENERINMINKNNKFM